jgi:diguanylate cyclase (GGDEF)-like protein
MSLQPHALFVAVAAALAVCVFMLVRLGQEYAANLKFQSHHDALTDLPNRLGLEDAMGRLLAGALDKGQSMALVFIGLDGFRQVNDLYGHRAGDAFLKQIAVRIQNVLKRGDVLTRVGADEFAVFLPNASDQAGLETLAAAILASIRGGSSVDSHRVSISASAGISLFPQQGKDSLTLFRLADLAMRRSKKDGGNRCSVWQTEMASTNFRTSEIVAMIRSALDDDRLHLVFQPIVDRLGQIVNMEALVRIHDFLLGSIPPDEFIQVAEQTGLIHELGAWIFRAVCKQARSWQDEGFRGAVTVNVSPAQLQAEGFAQTVLDSLAAVSLPVSVLVIEITENGIVRDPVRVGMALGTLRSAGVRISLDDFGAGYATLQPLLQEVEKLPVDSIKLHGSWTVRLPSDRNARQMVSDLVTQAHALGRLVAAEGIEESLQLEAARDLGCDLFQGYLIAPPLEAVDATQVLTGNSAVSGS